MCATKWDIEYAGKILVLTYAGVLFIVFLIKLPSAVEEMPSPQIAPTDIIFHAAAYALLTLSALVFWAENARRRVIFCSVFHGFTTEALQAITPWRTFSLADLATNLTGVLVAVAAYFVYKNFWEGF